MNLLTMYARTLALQITGESQGPLPEGKVAVHYDDGHQQWDSLSARGTGAAIGRAALAAPPRLRPGPLRNRAGR